jgi:hypothetical protein
MGEAAARWEALIHETLVASPVDKEASSADEKRAADVTVQKQGSGTDLVEKGSGLEAEDSDKGDRAATGGATEEGTSASQEEDREGASNGGLENGHDVSKAAEGRSESAAPESALQDHSPPGEERGTAGDVESAEGGADSGVVSPPVKATDLIETLEAEWHAGGTVTEKMAKLEGERMLRIEGGLGGKGSSRRYVQIASKQMVGVHVCVWVRKEVRKHVRLVQVSAVGVGLLGVLGNKGSVSVSLLLHESTLCFVCSHLTSGDADGDETKRSGDVSEIIRRTYFARSAPEQLQSLPTSIGEHDQRIWLGDLNYRICLPDDEVRALVKKQDWETLVQSDQLKLEQDAKQVFSDWQEGKIDFAPTYKYCPGTDRYVGTEPVEEGEKKRAPAWCDRILWKGDYLEGLTYKRAGEAFGLQSCKVSVL